MPEIRDTSQVEMTPYYWWVRQTDSTSPLATTPFFKSALSLLWFRLSPSHIVLSLSLLHRSSINNLLPQSSSPQLRSSCHSCCISSPPQDKPSIMPEYDTVPPEADAKQDALKEPGVAQRTDNEEDAPQKPTSDQKDPISSSKDERSPSGIDERISSPSPQPYYDCPDVGCTWPCAHHVHKIKGDRDFSWYSDLKQFGSDNSKIPRVQSKMKVGRKDCQICRIIFNIVEQSDCDWSKCTD